MNILSLIKRIRLYLSNDRQLAVSYINEKTFDNIKKMIVYEKYLKT